MHKVLMIFSNIIHNINEYAQFKVEIYIDQIFDPEFTPCNSSFTFQPRHSRI